MIESGLGGSARLRAGTFDQQQRDHAGVVIPGAGLQAEVEVERSRSVQGDILQTEGRAGRQSLGESGAQCLCAVVPGRLRALVAADDELGAHLGRKTEFYLHGLEEQVDLDRDGYLHPGRKRNRHRLVGFENSFDQGVNLYVYTGLDHLEIDRSLQDTHDAERTADLVVVRGFDVGGTAGRRFVRGKRGDRAFDDAHQGDLEAGRQRAFFETLPKACFQAQAEDHHRVENAAGGDRQARGRIAAQFPEVEAARTQ